MNTQTERSLERIRRERVHQIAHHGFTAEHDDGHQKAE